MKVNVEIECTPEEARRFIGLPDLTAVHEAYLAQLVDTVKSGVSTDTIEMMMKSWGPMSDAGFKMFQQMINGVGGLK